MRARARRAGICVTADVRAADLLDRLVVTARDASETYSLCRAIKQALPGVKVHLSADGAWVGAPDAPALLRLASDEVDLHWSAEARTFAENRAKAQSTHEAFRTAVAALVNGGLEAAQDHLDDDVTPLDGHQRVNVAAMTLPDGYGLCLFDEQGAGKTVSLIFAFDRLVARDEVDFALIVAPKAMLSEWQRDFGRFKGDLYRVVVVAGSRTEKRAALSAGADVLVTNFETVVSMERELAALLGQHGKRAVLVVDESFYVKNLDARRTRAARRLRELCGRAFVLCGTPAPNSPHDLVQQCSIVDFGLTFDGLSLPKERTAAQAVVQQALDQRAVVVRHLKSDVLPDLPGKRFTRVLLPLQPQQQRLYSAALRGLVADLRSVDDDTFQRRLASYLARRTALLQICSHPAAVVDGYSEVPAKHHALDSLLEDLITRRGEKVVLWSFYVSSLESLAARYARFNPLTYYGGVQDVATRRDSVRRFQEDLTSPLFIANPAAAGAGITLHAARYAVYESMSNQAAHYLQSLDRIHRRGQDRPVEYLVLLCDGTLEEQEYDRLMQKERAAQDLLGDSLAPPITRQTMLGELRYVSSRLRHGAVGNY